MLEKMENDLYLNYNSIAGTLSTDVRTKAPCGAVDIRLLGHNLGGIEMAKTENRAVFMAVLSKFSGVYCFSRLIL